MKSNVNSTFLTVGRRELVDFPGLSLRLGQDAGPYQGPLRSTFTRTDLQDITMLRLLDPSHPILMPSPCGFEKFGVRDIH
jgi:hypothetical protein